MMHDDGWVPDIVVGIDFGMTCTGVAYSRGPSWSEPKTIQHWPGKMISELANKVPTVLEFSQGASEPKGWGFSCDLENYNHDIIDLFKLHLDPSFQDPSSNAPTLQQAQRWFECYLRAVHDYIAEYFSDAVPKWRSQKVEFTFSVPTTWKNPSMIADIEILIRNAGFGTDGLVDRSHRASVGLTEAEAAAVYASQHQYDKDEVIVVADAGGGTTDVNVLKMLSSGVGSTRLQQLSWVEGQPVGSTAIDMEFHALVIQRLAHAQYLLKDPLEEVAEQMMHGRFERFKCGFGTALADAVPEFFLPVPGLDPGVNLPEAKIENSMMSFSKEELRNIFDAQVDRILRLIDQQFDKVVEKHPGIQISYLVLSGGLGSSEYVKKRLKAHYTTGPGSFKACVGQMYIATVEEPQLAVTHGLVLDRIQAISRGSEIFTERCCRLSYGIICMEEHNPDKPEHYGQPLVKDPRDGKTWVDNQIKWFIKQGESVSTDGILKPFIINRNPGQENDAWQTKVVMSMLPGNQLPTNINQDGSRRLCEVSSILGNQDVDMKLKNRHWYNFGRKKYYRFKFDVKVVLGSADLKFIMLSKDRKVLSQDHDSIEVVWEPASKASNPKRVSGGVPRFAPVR